MCLCCCKFAEFFSHLVTFLSRYCCNWKQCPSLHPNSILPLLLQLFLCTWRSLWQLQCVVVWQEHVFWNYLGDQSLLAGSTTFWVFKAWTGSRVISIHCHCKWITLSCALFWQHILPINEKPGVIVVGVNYSADWMHLLHSPWLLLLYPLQQKYLPWRNWLLFILRAVVTYSLTFLLKPLRDIWYVSLFP